LNHTDVVCHDFLVNSESSDGETVPNPGYLSRDTALTVGTRLHDLIKRKGVKVLDLEERSGVSKTTIYAVINGERDPTLGTLIRLAHELGLRSVEEFIAPLGTMQILKSEHDDVVA
jgi:plasmid maintenance system antidote protein VapI